MVGVGTQGDLAEAKAFVRRDSITFRMLWENGFTAWQGFSIQHQPASILVSPDGTKVKKWQGPLDESQRAEAARLAATPN